MYEDNLYCFVVEQNEECIEEVVYSGYLSDGCVDVVDEM